MKLLWEYILSDHPLMKNIFLKNKGFDIRNNSTFKKLISNLSIINIIDIDLLGNAYEEIIQATMTGKVLGQFFTQPIIKNIMVKLINPQIHDGTIESCCDPTMGTGGFLITYLHYILKQAKEKNIKPNWDFIKLNLYGKELETNYIDKVIKNELHNK